MVNNIKNSITTNLSNFRGWSTKRKLIIIESDDWGSIRMPSKQVYTEILKEGIKVNLCPYNTYDNLESAEDLDHLYHSLSKFSDKNGNPPVITTNTVMANPDFKKIASADFKEYHFEPFTATLQKYYPADDVIGKIREGVRKKYIYPQLHGREHLNPAMWLSELQNNEDIMKAFKLNFFGLSMITSPLINKPYLASLIYNNDSQKAEVEKSIKDAASLFKEIFGFTSSSLIAPLYTWDPALEDSMYTNGINYIQGANSHKTYDYVKNSRKSKKHNLGSKNSNGQIYLTRNCFFEPSLSASNNLEKVFSQIQNAFFWKKPAVICMHRLNFIGTLVEKNRQDNLKLLEKLIEKIMKKWPDAEFISSSQLGDIILSSKA